MAIARLAGGAPIFAVITNSPALMFQSHTASARAVEQASSDVAKAMSAICRCFVKCFIRRFSVWLSLVRHCSLRRLHSRLAKAADASFKRTTNVPVGPRRQTPSRTAANRGTPSPAQLKQLPFDQCAEYQ